MSRQCKAEAAKAGDEAPVELGPRNGSPDSLVLDIGGDVGALIVYADEALLGEEIDVTPEGEPHSHRMHTAIRRRRAAGRDVICGVYPQLVAGPYTVWGTNHRPLATIRVEGGRVSELYAPAASRRDGRTSATDGSHTTRRPD